MSNKLNIWSNKISYRQETDCPIALFMGHNCIGCSCGKNKN